MRNSIPPNRFLLLFACLFLVVSSVQAQDPESQADLDRDKAWLAVYIDPYGAATVTLEVQAQAHNLEQLKRALAESFSFPLQFRQVAEVDIDGDEPLTLISATSPKAFAGGLLEKTSRIDVQPLLPQLQQNQINSLKVRVVFRNGSRDVEIGGADRTAVGTANVDHFETDVDVRSGTTQVMEFSLGYSARDLSKKLLPLLLFLLLPAVWTNLSARRRSTSPEELWGRHLRFLYRLLNVVWLIWLPVYFFSGVSEVVYFVFFNNSRFLGQIVDVGFYFFVPVVAMFLATLPRAESTSRSCRLTGRRAR